MNKIIMNKFITPHENNLAILKGTTPSMRWDGQEDFSQWQSRATAKLFELLGMDKFKKTDSRLTVEYDRETADFRDIRFRFFSEENYSLPCHLCIPKNADKPLPLVICLQGHAPGMFISLGELRTEKDKERLEGDRAYAVRAVQEGYCALCIEQRNFGECGSNEDSSPNCYNSAVTALLIGRTTIGERVWDISRAIDAVEEHFTQYADIDRIICLGNSGGGTATFYAACIDRRIKIAVPSCALCTYEASIAAMRHCACNYIPHIAEYFDMSDLGGLIAPRGLVAVSGEKDGIFPIEGAIKTFEEIKRLFKAAGAEDNCVMYIGDEGHRFYADGAYSALSKLQI